MTVPDEPSSQGRATTTHLTSSPPPQRHDDEISLRELYLIARRGLPTIALVTAVAAIGAFVTTSLRPPSYEATATVISTTTRGPLVEDAQGNGGAYGDVRIDFDTYVALAHGATVYDAVGESVAGSITGERDRLRFERAFATRRITSAANDATLTVAHTVEWPDASEAAILANAWAEATVDAARRTLMDTVEPALLQASAAMESMGTMTAALDAARSALDVEDVAGVEGELAATNARLVRIDDELDVVDRSIARARASVDAWSTILASDALSGISLDLAALDVVVQDQIVDADTAAGIAASTSRGDDTGGRANVEAIVLLTVLRQRADLAGLVSERDQLVDARDVALGRADDLRTRLAALRSTASDLERQRAEIERSLGPVADLEPVLSFVAASIPQNTRPLNSAEPPRSSSSSSAGLATAVAAVVAALAATLFVFLREAVKEPAVAPRRS